MSTTAGATDRFIKDFERLPKSQKKHFGKIYPTFCSDPFNPQLDTEKLHLKVGLADAYSCRLNKAYRFIWTTEHSPSVLRLVGPHDTTYRHAGNMPPVQRDQVRFKDHFKKTERIEKESASKDVFNQPERIVVPIKRPGPPADSLEMESPAADSVSDAPAVYQLSANDLQALIEGNIASWMLFLAEPHKEFISRSFNGPARVTGPSGSGKTALLLHRAVHEAKRSKDAKVLVVCYNVALAEVLRVLLARLCGDDWDACDRIRVSHLDQLASDLCGHPSIVAYKQKLLGEACNHINPQRLRLHFESNTVDFLEREISIWIKGNPNISFDAYRNLKFPSSHVSLSQEEREEVLCVVEEYERIKGQGMDWEDLRNRALEKLENHANHPIPGVTAILVDEYQDFSVSALKLIMALAEPCRQNVFFCGDERQRIYCTNSSFRQLGIEVRGRALTLGTNYRNTHQIAKVASHLTKALEADETEGTLKPEQIAFPPLEGPRPILAGFRRQEDETEWIINKIQELLGNGYLPGEIGVLTPNWDNQSACAWAMNSRRIPHFILNGKTGKRFFEDGTVKLSTYHQAKGLEYKVVFCTGLSSAVFRKEFRYSGTEGQATMGSLLYMAVTRARDRLFLSFAGTPLKWLCTLDHALVETQGEAELLIIRCQDRLQSAEPAQPTLL